MELKKITWRTGEIFGADHDSSLIEENNSQFKFELTTNIAKIPLKDEIKSLLINIPQRDNFELKVLIEHQDEVFLSGLDNQEIEDFLEDLKGKLEHKDDEESLIIKLEINKNRQDNKLTVYSLNSLVSFWSKDGYINALKRIEELRNNVSQLLIFDHNESISSNALSFCSIESNIEHKTDVDRHAITSKRDKIGHFANASEYSFIPQDFCFDRSPKNEELKNLFEKLHILTSLVFLCDFSIFNGEKVHFCNSPILKRTLNY
tara:strand:+ start:24601 stop:25383 length:783 start_codon:yes stop_codon:yes gene_type:complete